MSVSNINNSISTILYYLTQKMKCLVISSQLNLLFTVFLCMYVYVNLFTPLMKANNHESINK